MRLSTLLTRVAPLRRPLALRDQAVAAPARIAQLPAHTDAPRMVAPFRFNDETTRSAVFCPAATV